MPTPCTSPLPGTPRPTRPAGPPRQIDRTRTGLLATLDWVKLEGWDGPAATARLTYIRHELIRPLMMPLTEIPHLVTVSG